MDNETFMRWVKIFAVSFIAIAILWYLFGIYMQVPFNLPQTVVVAVIGAIVIAMALVVEQRIMVRWLQMFAVSSLVIAICWAAFEYYVLGTVELLKVAKYAALIGVAVATAQLVMFPECAQIPCKHVPAKPAAKKAKAKKGKKR